MGHISGHPAAADTWSAWRALRPLLQLGGFAVVWWVLMTGVAQADDADPQRSSDPGHTALGGALVDTLGSVTQPHHETATAPVRKQAERAVRAASEHVVRPVREQVVRPVTDAAASAVRRTTQVVERTSAEVRSTVNDTVATTRDLVAAPSELVEPEPAADPAPEPTTEPTTEPAAAPVPAAGSVTDHAVESSAGHGDSTRNATAERRARSTRTTAADVVIGIDTDRVDRSSTSGRAPATTSHRPPAQSPAGQLPGGEPGLCASSTTSGQTAPSPLAATGSSWTTPSPMVRGLSRTSDERVPVGPAGEHAHSPG